MIWESSEIQFGRPKIKVDNIFDFFENPPPPLKKILDPPLVVVVVAEIAMSAMYLLYEH